MNSSDHAQQQREPIAWIVQWRTPNTPKVVSAYVKEDDARRAAKNVAMYAHANEVTVTPAYAAFSSQVEQPASAQQQNTAEIEKLRALLQTSHQNCLALWEALEGGPSPRCRDCADFNGRCQGTGDACEPQERALETIKKLRRALIEIEREISFGSYIEYIQQIARRALDDRGRKASTVSSAERGECK